MGSTYYIKDFYDDIKNRQQDLINNHSKLCQKGGYSILSQQIDKLSAQQKLNNIRREQQINLNNKINNIMKKMQMGGNGKMTLGENIKLLKQMIKDQCKIEKNLLKNIKTQQKCIKQKKLYYLPSYQSKFNDEIKRANNINKNIKKLHKHINKIIEKKNNNLKYEENYKFLKVKQEAKVATLNNLKSIIDKIKQR